MFEIFLEIAFFVFLSALRVIFDYYYLWLPIFLGLLAWETWKRYVVTLAVFTEEKVLLQIKLPRELYKSPRAMELFLQNLHQLSGEGNPYDKYWKGGTRPWFSLELVSIEGEIRFYIWTRQKQARSIELGLYSQFPGLEVIVGAPDYTRDVQYDETKKTLYGTYFTLVKDDPYPIKTYIDFGLDDDPKEEYKIDPIASMTEFLGSIGRGEQIWIQILVRAHKKYEKKSLLEKIIKKLTPDIKKYKNVEERGKEIITKLLDEVPKDEEGIAKGVVKQTKHKEKIIESIERSFSKPGFDTAIRGIYIADEDKFDKANIGGLLGGMKQYSSDGLNGFKPDNKTDFDYPWQDLTGGRLAKKKKDIFREYIQRARFESRHNVEDFILNTEELATIYHFPGSSVETPNLPRIPSTKAQPPSNLPL